MHAEWTLYLVAPCQAQTAVALTTYRKPYLRGVQPERPGDIYQPLAPPFLSNSPVFKVAKESQLWCSATGKHQLCMEHTLGAKSDFHVSEYHHNKSQVKIKWC